MSASWAKPEGKGPEFFTAFALGLAAFLAYLITLAPTVATNDAGRFQTAAPLLGTGHPTGYPTFILVGKLFTFLPFGDVAYRMNLMAAVFGGIAVALVYLVSREIGASKAPAVGSAFLFAFSAAFWSQATFAEVYSMHMAFLLGVTFLLLRWRDHGKPRNLVLAGFLYGLSLGNNAGMVLLAPAFLILMAAGRSLSAKAVITSGAAALLGLSIYAYVPIRGFAGAYHNYGDPVDTWNDVWRLVSGARFQGLMGTGPLEMLSNAGDFLYELSMQSVQPFGYLLAVVVLAGGAYGAAVVFSRDRVVGASLVVAILCTLLYALSYDIDDISVYYLPVYTLLFLTLSAAVTHLSRSFRSFSLAVAPVILAALVFGLNFVPSDKSGYYAERERSEQTLATLPEDAILYGKVPIVPITYLTEIEGRREDVTLRWLDGGTLDREFESDIESGRPVFFISDPRYNEEYLAEVEPHAEAEMEDDFIRLIPNPGE
ncbi:MAG: glycosyltransferase family 117 protein [Rubrobacteraceae bacterium]